MAYNDPLNWDKWRDFRLSSFVPKEKIIKEDFNIKYEKQADKDWMLLQDATDKLGLAKRNIKKYSKSSWDMLQKAFDALDDAQEHFIEEWRQVTDREIKETLNEGSSNRKAEIAGFYIDDKVKFSRVIRNKRVEGTGTISSITIVSKKLSNVDEFSIAVKGGVIPSIRYEKGKFYEMSSQYPMTIEKL